MQPPRQEFKPPPVYPAEIDTKDADIAGALVSMREGRPMESGRIEEEVMMRSAERQDQPDEMSSPKQDEDPAGEKEPEGSEKRSHESHGSDEEGEHKRRREESEDEDEVVLEGGGGSDLGSEE